MTRQEREELNNLSKQAFGTSSKWKKLMDNGFPEVYERDREVLVPKANGQITKKTFTDKKSIIKHYSLEEVKKVMLDIILSRKPKNEITSKETKNV